MSANAEAGSRGGLFRNSAVMAAGSLTSRLLGFGRILLTAFVLGASTPLADVLNFANGIPGMIYMLIAGGTLNTVLVPQIVRAIHHDDDGGQSYIDRIVTLFLLVMGAVTLLCLLATPLLVPLWVPGWRGPESRPFFDNLMLMSYLTMPQIFFFGLFFIMGQVLNAKNIFGPMMWAPAANNVVQIATLLIYIVRFGRDAFRPHPFTPDQAMLLGIGFTLGIVAQAATMLPFLRRARVSYRPRFDFKGTGLGHTLKVARWVVYGVALGQVALTIVNALASSATGHAHHGAGLSIYNNAMLFWTMPHGLITVSVTTAIIPLLSRLAADHDAAGLRRETSRALRLTSTMMVPVAIGLAVLAFPLMHLCFSRPPDGDFTARTLIPFALGLPPFTAAYVLTRAFFALEDTRRNFLLSALFDLFNVVFALLFVLPFRDPGWVAPGLAASYALAQTVTLPLYYRALRVHVPGISLAATFRHWVRLAIATAPGAVAAWFVASAADGHNRLLLLLALALAGAIGMAGFVGMARLLHITEVGELVRMVTSRLGRLRGGAVPSPPEALADTESTVATAVPATEADGRISAAVPLADPEAGPAATGASQPEADATDEPEPEPDADEPEPDAAAPAEPTADVHPGDRLGGRYLLTEQVDHRGRTLTWRAQDEVLSRDVLIHVLAPRDPAADDLLAAARRAAIATDSRFLRVLDAVQTSSETVGPYVVCEHVEGQTLAAILADGPLSALEAAWLTRELADALTAMHAQGLHHQRIAPDTVVITRSGNVKLLGFLTEAVLRPRPGDDDLAEPDREAADVAGIGKLLYASLVARWPGGNRFGLPAAPTDAAGWATPRQVRAGISPALDHVADRILSRPPHDGQPPLRTTADVVVELSRVLGSAEASADLEKRVRTAEERPADAGATAAPRPEPGEAGQEARQAADGDRALFTPVPPPRSATAATPPAGARGPATGRGRILLLALAGLVVLALAIAAILLAARGGPASPPPPHTVATPSVEPKPLPLHDAKDFDPEGSKGENPNQLAYAIDADPASAWHTEIYPTADFSGKKSGVGLYVDLAAAHEVRRVVIDSVGEPTSFVILVPADPGANAAPTDAVNQWRRIGSKDGAGTHTVFAVEPTKTRFVLIWITSLPQTSAGYQAAISNIEVDE